MSNAVFPSLPGLTFDIKRVPTHKTVVKESASGREYRGRLMPNGPRYTYTLGFDLLSDNGSWTDGFRTLLGFYNARSGAFDSFLFNDPDDNSVTNQSIGVGDGSTKSFQLVRTLGGASEPVYDTNSVPVIKDNGTTKTAGTDYNISTTGLVTFTSAPVTGHSLTWTGTYYWRCRFGDDSLTFNQFMSKLWELKQCNLITLKP